jgi:tRNA(fMet)-specific endonuclease VapC
MKDNPIVKRHLDALTDSDYYFTIPIVQGEILYGIERSPPGRKQQDLLQSANHLFSQIQCEPIPKETGNYYAQLKRQVEQQGTSLAANDLWIAATALALDAILVTSDGDFYRVSGFSNFER